VPPRTPARKTPSRRSRRKRLALNLQVGSHGVRVPALACFRLWARAALRKRGEITVRIVGGAEARRLNRLYRGRDYATDVLAFSYGELHGCLQGDLVLCAPVVAREALEQGKTLKAHFAHLTVHALLHLQGYDHAGRRQAARMEARERKLLAKLGYPDPYAG